MTREEIAEIFRNNSDCYADTWTQGEIGYPMIEGKVIQAMTEETFVNIVWQMSKPSGIINLLPNQSDKSNEYET